MTDHSLDDEVMALAYGNDDSGPGDALNKPPCLVCDSPEHSANDCPFGDGCDPDYPEEK